MTPKEFQYHVDAKNEEVKERSELEQVRIKNQEYIAWLTGFYVRLAVAELFGGKSASKYPQKPLTDHSDSIAEIAEKNGKTEEELNAELVMATLQIREANARIENVQNGKDVTAD